MASAEWSLQQLLEHREFLSGLCRRLVKNEAEAEDAEQRTWFSAMRKIPSALNSPRAWLSRVLSREVSMGRRESSRRFARERIASRPEAVPSVAAVVQEEALRREVIESVLELEEGQRSVILLRFYRGLDNRRIATELGLPLETVRTRQKRGITALRERLDSRYGKSAWPVLLAPLADMKNAALPLASTGILVAAAALLLIGVALVVLSLSSDKDPEDSKALDRVSPPIQEEEGRKPKAQVASEQITTSPLERGQRERLELSEVATLYPGSEPLSGDGRRAMSITRVFDSITGEPLPGTRVDIFAEQQCPMADRRLILRSTETDADGYLRVRIDDILDSIAGYLFRREGYADTAELGGYVEAAVAMTAAESRELLLLDARGTPVPEAQVEVFLGCGHTMATQVARSDESGRVVLRNLTVRSGDLWITKRGYRVVYTSISNWTPGDPPEVITLFNGPVYEGRIVDEAGRPLPGAFVGAPEAHRGPWCQADANGFFVLVGAFSDVFKVVLKDGPEQDPEVDVEIPDGSGLILLRRTAAGFVAERATSEAGAPSASEERPADQGSREAGREETPAVQPNLRLLWADGEPVDRGAIGVLSGGAYRSLVTDAEGVARGEWYEMGGSWRIAEGARVRARGPDSLSFLTTLQGPGPWTLRLPSGSVTLHFARPDGLSEDDVDLFLDKKRWSLSSDALTVRGVGPGLHEVLLCIAGQNPARGTFHLEEGQHRDFDLSIRGK